MDGKLGKFVYTHMLTSGREKVSTHVLIGEKPVLDLQTRKISLEIEKTNIHPESIQRVYIF